MKVKVESVYFASNFRQVNASGVRLLAADHRRTDAALPICQFNLTTRARKWNRQPTWGKL